jgi:hypothetical protein
VAHVSDFQHASRKGAKDTKAAKQAEAVSMEELRAPTDTQGVQLQLAV